MDDKIDRLLGMVDQQSPKRTVISARRVVIETQSHREPKSYLDIKVILKSRPLFSLVLVRSNSPTRFCHPDYFVWTISTHRNAIKVLQHKFGKFVGNMIVSSAFSSMGNVLYLLGSSPRNLYNYFQQPLRSLTCPMVPI